VPLSGLAGNPAHIAILEQWLKSYKPEELFDENGTPFAQLRELAPTGQHRIGDNPHANGGVLLRDLRLPNFRDYAINVAQPGAIEAEATRVMGAFLRDVMKDNHEQQNFRIFGPDETSSNRWDDVFSATSRVWMEKILPEDTDLSQDGRVMEILSEHTCQGWLEGYLLTGRHGFFSCYEAFIHLIDSMFNQHAK
jgi:xylulose-5-phosphate/fructose-6-phosphate phosphoketolase